ncbi:MAG: alpha/beta hydrolase, partial [Flavobacteriia bacterium]
IVSLVLYLIQEKFIFHGVKIPMDYKFSFENDFEEISLKTDDGKVLNAVLFKRQNPKGLILFFHNHAGNVIKWSDTAVFFSNYNYDVLLVDYRGFGKSTGKFNEKKMLNDAQLWYDTIKDKYAKIIVFGRGLGAFFAAKVAADNSIDQLILESPVYNLTRAGKFIYPYQPFYLLLKYQFDCSEDIKKVQCKITILHGKKDKVICYESGQELYELNKEHADFILIEDADHFNLINHPVYLETIDKLLG